MPACQYSHLLTPPKNLSTPWKEIILPSCFVTTPLGGRSWGIQVQKADGPIPPKDIEQMFDTTFCPLSFWGEWVGGLNVCQTVWPHPPHPSARVNLLGMPEMGKRRPTIRMQPLVNPRGILSLSNIWMKQDRAENSGCQILEMSNPQIWEKPTLLDWDKLFRLWHETVDDVTASPSLSVWQLLNLLPKGTHMLNNNCVTLLDRLKCLYLRHYLSSRNLWLILYASPKCMLYSK